MQLELLHHVLKSLSRIASPVTSQLTNLDFCSHSVSKCSGKPAISTTCAHAVQKREETRIRIEKRSKIMEQYFLQNNFHKTIIKQFSYTWARRQEGTFFPVVQV